MTDTDMFYMASLEKKNNDLEAKVAELEDKHHNECGQIAHYSDELRKAKRLLKAAVEDFAKIDRENTKNKNCMMPEMDCADCPLSWDSVDDRVEPCHSWRYTTEALALIGDDTNVPASADDTNVGHKSGGWISCKDRMPEVNEPVLFIFNTESGFKAVMYGWHETIKGLGSGWHQAGVGGARANEEVTYWQPLPEPPKE